MLRNKRIYRGEYEKTRLLYRILLCIKDQMYSTQIARKLNTPRTTIQYYIKKLLKFGYIRVKVKSNVKIYELTKDGEWLLNQLKNRLLELTNSSPRSKGQVDEMRLHNFAIKFPILKDNPNFDWDKVNEKIRNWTESYKFLPQYGITVKKTTKNIIVYLHQFYAKDFSEWLNKVLLTIAMINSYLERNGIRIDIFNGEVISQHISITLAKDIEAKIKQIIGYKPITCDVNLNRKAKSIYPTKLDAKAWIDWSLGRLELETNDVQYVENFILMPERVARFEELAEFIIMQQAKFAKNLSLHHSVLNEMKETLKSIRETLEKMRIMLEGNLKNE